MFFQSPERRTKPPSAQINEPKVTQKSPSEITMADVSKNPSFLDPSSALDASRKTKHKAEAIRIAKQQEFAVHEKLKRSGLEIPKFEFLELIGKGAYGRVFKR